MSAPPDSKSEGRPAPRAVRSGRHESFFALFGGPLAWYLQLCAGYALASAPCYRAGERLQAPPPALDWTWAAMIAAMVAAVAIALLAWMVSWRVYQGAQEQRGGSASRVMAGGSGRTHFLALWGVFLGSGFAVATAMTAVAFLTLQRCA